MTATSEPNDEYNLQEAWERVCRSFAQTTKVDLTTAPNYTIEEVLEQIRAREAEDLERNAKYNEGKAAIDQDAGICEGSWGHCCAGREHGTSQSPSCRLVRTVDWNVLPFFFLAQVFAPRSLCFNAIAYLIDTGAKFKRIFSSLAELFRKICDVLGRM